MNTEREKYLESLIPAGLDYENKYFVKFEKFARYMGNGCYEWMGIMSTCTRELFLMGVLQLEKIEFKQE